MRRANADVEALIRLYSDVPSMEFPLNAERTDPTFAPAFKLRSGQVSDPVRTPYGAIVFIAIE